ncbi:hypothetical protein KOR42_23740 [Thalassoglobus neptunius]|uniref:Uncharacterized protein n=1 Tax=Thalassoglobus neptunius TaxID=1938619 RepID=A0A5C5X794_9PLAN|nr:hypothetical protein [Thalassoglobus neptunius]TWT58987.1 hypothetical protein KOR42_23740 [Thalassoglobus neptunius]
MIRFGRIALFVVSLPFGLLIALVLSLLMGAIWILLANGNDPKPDERFTTIGVMSIPWIALWGWAYHMCRGVGN